MPIWQYRHCSCCVYYIHVFCSLSRMVWFIEISNWKTFYWTKIWMLRCVQFLTLIMSGTFTHQHLCVCVCVCESSWQLLSVYCSVCSYGKAYDVTWGCVWLSGSWLILACLITMREGECWIRSVEVHSMPHLRSSMDYPTKAQRCVGFPTNLW